MAMALRSAPKLGEGGNLITFTEEEEVSCFSNRGVGLPGGRASAAVLFRGGQVMIFFHANIA